MKKRIKRVLIILMVVIIYIIIHKFFRYSFFQEDLIFFDFLNISKQHYSNKIGANESSNNNEIINIEKNKITEQKIDLFQLLQKNIQIREKLFPGSNGYVSVILKSKEEINYKAYLKNESEKPINLKLYLSEGKKQYNDVEEFADNLYGKVAKNQNKKINIIWNWEYEQNTLKNRQDTSDAKKIKDYKFTICVKGY